MLKLKRFVTKCGQIFRCCQWHTINNQCDDILNDPDIDIVVEVIGGESQRTIILLGHQNKKYVVMLIN